MLRVRLPSPCLAQISTIVIVSNLSSQEIQRERKRKREREREKAKTKREAKGRMDRRSRRQRARQLKTELMAAYQHNNTNTNNGSNSSSLAAVQHLLPSHQGSSNSNTIQFHLVDWIEQDPTLLWEPLAGGATLMHWAAQHLRYEQINHCCAKSAASTNIWKSASGNDDKNVTDPWEWLLQHAASSSRPQLLVQQCDSAGESCLDCFMSAWHYGRRHGDPYQFAAAVDVIRQEPHLQDQLRRLVEMHQSSASNSKPVLRVCSDRRVTTVARVWQAWTRLCRAANPSKDVPLLPFMAQTGRALESFAWLAVTLCPQEAHIVSALDGKTPLHLWACSSPTPVDDELDALWLHLLLVHPSASCVTDRDGRLPLHLALARANKPVRQARRLAAVCPATLGMADPHTSADGGAVLYPFATAAIAASLEVRAVLRATQRRSPSQRLYDWLDTTRQDIDAYEQEVSTALLGHVYVMLRALPQALEYNRQAVMAHQAEMAKSTSDHASSSRTFTANTVKDAYAKVLHDLV